MGRSCDGCVVILLNWRFVSRGWGVAVSFSSPVVMQCSSTQLPKIIVTRWVDVILAVGILEVTFEYPLVMTTPYCLPDDIFGNDRRKTVTTNSSSPVIYKIWGLRYQSIGIPPLWMSESPSLLRVLRLPYAVRRNGVSMCRTYNVLLNDQLRTKSVREELCLYVMWLRRICVLLHPLVVVIRKSRRNRTKIAMQEIQQYVQQFGTQNLKHVLAETRRTLAFFPSPYASFLRGSWQHPTVVRGFLFQQLHYTFQNWMLNWISVVLIVAPLVLVHHQTVWGCLFHQFRVATMRHQLES